MIVIYSVFAVHGPFSSQQLLEWLPRGPPKAPDELDNRLLARLSSQVTHTHMRARARALAPPSPAALGREANASNEIHFMEIVRIGQHEAINTEHV